MAETLLVSKPLAPPWNDSGKNLVRDLVRHCTDLRHRVLTVRGFSLGLPHVTEEPIYGDSGSFSPSLWQNARVLARLLQPDRQDLYHFFFAPNPRTSGIARIATALKGRKTVQTVMSVPTSFDDVERLLFADRVVVLSRWTHARLVVAGVDGVVHIPPGIDPGEPVPEASHPAIRQAFGFPPDLPVVVFPGDYEFSRAADTLAGAIPEVLADTDAVFVYACRMKRDESRGIEKRIRAQLASHEERGSVKFVGEIPNIGELLAVADLVVLPSASTYAKMDVPLVLLEALAAGTPVVVADVAPLNEVLGTDDRRPETPVGRAVTPDDAGALAAAVGELLADPDRRQRMGRAGRAWVTDRFSAAAMGAAHGALYRELLDG